MDRRQNPLVMNSSAFQKRFNYAAHGENCSDTNCVLPVCVNHKLANRHGNAPPTDKQNSHTGGVGSYIAVNSWKFRETSKEMSLNRATLDHDTDKQLLEEIEEFEKVFESHIADFGDHAGFGDPFEIDQGNSNPTYPTQEDCQVRRQAPREQTEGHQPNVIDYAPTFNTHRRPILRIPVVPTVGPNPDSTEDPLLLNYYEHFVPMNQYTVPSEKSDGTYTKLKRTRTHQDVMPEAAALMRNTDSGINSTTGQPKGAEPKTTRKMFGVLAEILLIFEKPMPAEVEAFVVQILQKALKEIKNVLSHERFKCANFRARTGALK